MESLRTHDVTLDRPPEAALEAVAEGADRWNGDWRRDGSGGRLRLPVLAGLRRGWLEATVSVRREGEGSRLTLHVERSDLRLQGPAVLVLAIAAGGTAAVVLWPFFPELLPLAGIGLVLAVAAWFMILSRLQNSGPEEFLRFVEEHGTAGGEAGGEGGGAGAPGRLRGRE